MIAGSGYFLWQKRAGTVAMVLLVAALLSLTDGLIGGFKGGQAKIELTPGSRYAISGPLPPRTEQLKEFVIEGQPADGSVQLIPEAIFSGYWFGGPMWRGAIVIDPRAREGSHEIAVKDGFGEKQNPTLVFRIKVWPDQAALQAHSPSRLTRLTGHSPFVIAFGLALSGLAAMGANFLLGRLWARHLRQHSCGEIYKLRRLDQGAEITCELPCNVLVRADMDCTIFRATGELLCTARVARCDNGEVQMLVREPGCVRLGDIACLAAGPLEPAALAATERATEQ